MKIFRSLSIKVIRVCSLYFERAISDTECVVFHRLLKSHESKQWCPRILNRFHIQISSVMTVCSHNTIVQTNRDSKQRFRKVFQRHGSHVQKLGTLIEMMIEECSIDMFDFRSRTVQKYSGKIAYRIKVVCVCVRFQCDDNTHKHKRSNIPEESYLNKEAHR